MPMKKRLKIIFVAFSVSFLFMIGLSLFSLGRFATFTNYSDELMHSNTVIRTLFRTEVFFKDIDRWERGYILSNDSGYVRAIYNTTDSMLQMMDSLEHLLVENPVQARNMIDLRENLMHRISYSHENIIYIDTSHSREASQYYFEGRKYTIATNRLLRAMHRIEATQLQEKQEKQEFYRQLATSTIKTLLIIFCTVTLILFALLIKLMRAGMLYQEKLHAKIIDLKRSHSELQDIAYSISHDLQEPLRKIQVFSSMLMVRRANDDTDDSKSTLERIHGSANRMQSLIADLESLTNLTRIDEHKVPINLSMLAEHVINDIKDTIKESGAVVRVEQLPVLRVYESQMNVLFRALLDNALKFVKDDVKPEIYISYRMANGNEISGVNRAMPNQQFHCISISDNGIGFDNKYISNIFKIFRRLHTEGSRYEGKGIGLAICQRIMTNHEGYIIGEGVPDQGATFKLFFPA